MTLVCSRRAPFATLPWSPLDKRDLLRTRAVESFMTRLLLICAITHFHLAFWIWSIFAICGSLPCRPSNELQLVAVDNPYRHLYQEPPA